MRQMHSMQKPLGSGFQFSPLTDWVVGGHEGRFSTDPLPAFSAGGYCGQFWHKQGRSVKQQLRVVEIKICVLNQAIAVTLPGAENGSLRRGREMAM